MPTSWNVTPHRDEHGYPATMTGDDGMEVLDLDMELDEHALRVFQLHSQPWLKARLQFYKEKSDALWRRRRNGSFQEVGTLGCPPIGCAPPTGSPVARQRSERYSNALLAII